MTFLNLIYENKWYLTQEDNKTHQRIYLNTAKAMNALIIEFSYHPSIADEMTESTGQVNNLVTVSVYCEDEYIGCAHRHEASQKIILSKNSTKGFKNIMIKPYSKLEIVLSVHAAYSNAIEVRLSVHEYKEK